MPSATEMLFALGLEDRIVGVTINCNWPPQAKAKAKIGGFFLNLEKIVSLRPDMVVMVAGAQDQSIAELRSRGLPVTTIRSGSLADILSEAERLGQLTGRTTEAEELTSGMRLRLASVEAKVRGLARPTVLVVVGTKPLVVVGENNFIADIIDLAGAENVAAGAETAYPQYSLEALLESDPEYIIFPEGLIDPAELGQDPRWQSLSAVAGGRLLFIDPDVLTRPGPRSVQAVEQIAEFIHEQETQ